MASDEIAIKTEEVQIDSSLSEEEQSSSTEPTSAPARLYTCGNVKTRKCYLCPTNPSMASEEDLFQHMLDDHSLYDSAGLYRCAECSVEVRTLTAFNQHLSRHDATLRPHHCSMCPMRFRRNNRKKEHESVVHGIDHGGLKKLVQLRPPFCNLCNTSFAQVKELTPHFQSAHPEVSLNLFPCVDCDAVFLAYDNLKAHRRIHTDKNYCELCGRRFVERKDLAYHQFKVHQIRLDETAYVTCTICNKEFLRGSRYNRHFRTHDNAKPFSCEFCDKAFRDSRSLELHLVCHGNGTPVPCDQCEKQFTQKSSLVRHKSRYHQEKL